MSVSIPDVLIVTGAGLVVGAIAVWSVSGAVLVAGVGLIAIGLLGVYRA